MEKHINHWDMLSLGQTDVAEGKKRRVLRVSKMKRVEVGGQI